MPTRFKTKNKRNFGISPLQTGYKDSSNNSSLGSHSNSNLFINSCGLEDVDVSLFNLFEKEIIPTITQDNDTKKVPIMFAAGEKWAMIKKGRPIRDQKGSLILPLITITRQEIIQSIAEDITKRGINQQTGEMTIRRKLDPSDRNYQSLINSLLIKNQTNLSVNSNDSRAENQPVVERKLGDDLEDDDVRNGAFLKPKLKNNRNHIFETIVVPMPQFYTVKYQITVWTQYVQHSNQILEKIIASFLPQSQSWRLDTEKGYWFVATVDAGTFNTETSFDDMTESERFVKHNFIITVPAYIFASKTPGAPIPLKRYVSSPTIEFKNFGLEGDLLGTEVSQNKYLMGSDDPTLPLDEQKNELEDQRSLGMRQQKSGYIITEHDPNNPGKVNPNDPARTNMPRGYRYLKIKSKNSKGEIIYSGYTLDDIE